MAGRPPIHKASATLPDGKHVDTITVGCKPYLVATRTTIGGKSGPWEVNKWCDIMDVARSRADSLRQKFSTWDPKTKLVEVVVLTTSCHIASGPSQEN